MYGQDASQGFGHGAVRTKGKPYGKIPIIRISVQVLSNYRRRDFRDLHVAPLVDWNRPLTVGGYELGPSFLS